jgi:hypothetical protein
LMKSASPEQRKTHVRPTSSAAPARMVAVCVYGLRAHAAMAGGMA